MPYERLSDRTLGELIALLRDRTLTPSCNDCHFCGDMCTADVMPLGAVVNDIGILFLNGEPDAEKTLASLMEDDETASIAFFYLTQRRDRITSHTTALLEKFENDPINAQTLDAITQHIATILSTH